ncbi:unnamed protein product, partial [Meganyctiphanes norvegica]
MSPYQTNVYSRKIITHNKKLRKIKKLNFTYEENNHSPKKDLHRHLGLLNSDRDLLGLYTELESFYVPIASRINNKECKIDVEAIPLHLTNIKNGIWAMEMVDSWGKFPDGWFFGNIHSVGMFEECLKVHANYKPLLRPRRNFTGQYCTISYMPQEKNDTVRSPTMLALLKIPLPYFYGTCIPSTCTKDDMASSVNVTLVESNRELVSVICQTEPSLPKEVTPADIAVIVFLLVLVTLAFLATVFDVLTATLPNFRQGKWQFVLAFSLYASMTKLWSYAPTTSKSGLRPITCLYSVRCITMVWIVNAHQLSTGITFLANTLDAPRYDDPLINQVMGNAWFSVDSFLFMTGLVLAYRALPLVKRGTFNPFILFLKRFCRLWPSLFVICAFCSTVIRFIGRGPRQWVLAGLQQRCAKHWWRDVLFINNFIIGNNKGELGIEDCLDQSWYSAVDFQLMLFLPLLLFPLYWNKRAGELWLSFVSLLSVIIPMVITIVYNLPPTLLTNISLEVHREYVTKMYLVPWCRAGPWLVGVWTALALHSPRVANIKIHKVVVALGYILVFSLGFLILLCLYPWNNNELDIVERPKLSRGFVVLYGSCARPLWGLMLAWVVITCHTGNAKLINRFLSYPGLWPLGRLCFGMYLTSPVVQVWWDSMLMRPIYYNSVNKILESAGIIFVSGVVTVLITCLVEMPFYSLLHLLLAPKSKTSDAQDLTTDKIKRRKSSLSEFETKLN